MRVFNEIDSVVALGALLLSPNLFPFQLLLWSIVCNGHFWSVLWLVRSRLCRTALEHFLIVPLHRQLSECSTIRRRPIRGPLCAFLSSAFSSRSTFSRSFVSYSDPKPNCVSIPSPMVSLAFCSTFTSPLGFPISSHHSIMRQYGPC